MLEARFLRVLLVAALAFSTPVWCCCFKGGLFHAATPEHTSTELIAAASVSRDAARQVPPCHPAPQPVERPCSPCGTPADAPDRSTDCDCPSFDLATGDPSTAVAVMPGTASQMLWPAIASSLARHLTVDVPVLSQPIAHRQPLGNRGESLRARHCLLLI